MSDKRWKQYERKVARFFGTERTPLSGINSRHDTSSDTLHKTLYIECKSASGPSGTNRWLWTWLNRLGWPTTPGRCYRCMSPILYLYHSSCIPQPPAGLEVCEAIPAAGMRLWSDVLAAARHEGKAPLLALFGKGKRGFWLVGTAGCLLAAIKKREAVVKGEG